ncbi:cell division protein FtsQ [Bifidobacterium callitrichidarum]|uniref:Cell division protein FtsQ n=1 Tax=Bifidobacterium callitrichidarum TaxID=2052941 RepID=A0A2U2N3N5_9BIFI|nr:cell division protein FtsQ [Bifidobacterium callitrichidarum]
MASHHDGESASVRGRGAAPVERPSSTDVTVAKGQAGAFVDARRLRSEDYVTETLHQTTGMLGIASRPKVVDFTERAKERKRASARVIAVRVLAALAGIAVLAGLTWLLFFSTVFRLETGAISVTGANEWVSAQTIHAIADKQAGKSLFLVSTNDVANQLKDIPGVSEAKVSRRFPKAMSVEITAQKPAAMLKSGDTLTAVDAEARVLNSVSSKDVDGIPVIEVKDVETSLKNRSVKEALTILGALPESMRQQITKVTAETQDSVTTTLDGGERVIVWGDSSQLKLKMAVVDKIINDPNVIGERHQVDVSAPLKPIIK